MTASEHAEDRGDAHIVVYLAGVTTSQINELVEAIADLVRDHGLACANDEDSVAAVIGVKPEPFPDLDDVETFLSAHSMLTLPTTHPADPAHG